MPTLEDALTLNPAAGFHVFNVMAFGALGDGDEDDTDAIQAAVNAAASSGSGAGAYGFGGYVFFPAGVYITTSPILPVGQGSLLFVGAGIHCCALVGNYDGYTIDKPDDGAQNFEGCRGMTVANTRVSLCAGAIRACGAQNAIFEDLGISAFTGIDASSNTYCLRISNVEVVGLPNRPYGSCGIYAAQAGLYQVRCQGLDNGICVFNSGVIIHGCAVETSNTGIGVGLDRGNAFLASIAGDVLTVTTIHAGGGTDLAGDGGIINFPKYLFYPGLASGVTITSQLTTTEPSPFPDGKRGTYQLNTSVGTVAERDMMTYPGVNAMNGLHVAGFQTERCLDGISCWSGSGISINGVTLTGTLGPAYTVTGITWSGGTATATLLDPHYQGSGTQEIKIEGGAYTGQHTGTFVVGGATITFTSADLGTSGECTWSKLCQHGLRVRGVNNLFVSGLQTGISAEQAHVDLYFDGGTSGTQQVIVGYSGTFIMPPTNQWATWQWINCKGTDFNPKGQFSWLPGEAGGPPDYDPADGMEYIITDGQLDDGTSNDTPVTWRGPVMGGGTQHVKVRWSSDDDAWLAIG